MIALVLAAHLISVHYYTLTWSVVFDAKTNPVTFSKTFYDSDQAEALYDKAPMCFGATPKEPPCVLWIRLHEGEAGEEKQIKRKE